MKVKVKLRHAAALALTGWYLMVPAQTKGGPIDTSLPLSQWTMFESFDTAAGCQRKKSRVYDEAQRKDRAGDTKGMADFYSAARCIATDDPRLKEK